MTRCPDHGRPWQDAVAEFGVAIRCSPPRAERHANRPFEIGVVGLAGVGKSSLLNALIAPRRELLPSGGIGPLTGVPVRLCFASVPTLRVRYLGRAWWLDALTKLGGSGLSSHELGRLSLACTGNQYAIRDRGWLERAVQYALQPGVVKPPDAHRETIEALRPLRELLACGGIDRQWNGDPSDGALFRHIHEHVAGQRAALCERVDVGWPSSLLEAGLVVVDLPGLGTASDSHSQHTDVWVKTAKAIVVVTDRAGIAESVDACLRRSGFLNRVADGDADLLGVVTKLDQVTDDTRRRDRSGQKWSSCFRQTVERAETEMLGQLAGVLRPERGARIGRGLGSNLTAAIRVFGVSSREYRRVVERDDEERPRLYLSESTGIPAVRRALVALGRLRSSQWTSDLLDRVRADSDVATLLPALISLVEMEGS
jgi:GTP-binding protein EngB required for normal cell division